MRRPTPLPVGPDQESVWSYPRPPRLELSSEKIEVTLGGVTIVSTSRAYRVLETSHPPTYYLPFADARIECFVPASGYSVCEWKGAASYFDLVVGERVEQGVCWTYRNPTATFAAIFGCFALYPGRMDFCTVDGEVVTPQVGGFYGGWITSRVVGPFKGEPGSNGW